MVHFRLLPTKLVERALVQMIECALAQKGLSVGGFPALSFSYESS